MKKTLLTFLIVFAGISLFGQTEVTIHDIQFTENAGSGGTYPSSFENQQVTTSGIVTGVQSWAAKGYYIQEADAEWSGIFVFDSENVPEIGDKVKITGKVVEYYGFTEIKEVSSFEVVSNGNTVFEPIFVENPADVNNEKYEGVLVKVKNVTCSDAPDQYGQWYVENHTLQIDDNMYNKSDFTPTVGNSYDIRGVVDYNFQEYAILPTSANDISDAIAVNELQNKVVLYPNPVVNTLHVSEKANIEVLNMVGQVIYKAENTDNVEFSNFSRGVYLIKVENENGSFISKIVKK